MRNGSSISPSLSSPSSFVRRSSSNCASSPSRYNALLTVHYKSSVLNSLPPSLHSLTELHNDGTDMGEFRFLALRSPNSRRVSPWSRSLWLSLTLFLFRNSLQTKLQNSRIHLLQEGYRACSTSLVSHRSLSLPLPPVSFSSLSLSLPISRLERELNTFPPICSLVRCCCSGQDADFAKGTTHLVRWGMVEGWVREGRAELI